MSQRQEYGVIVTVEGTLKLVGKTVGDICWLMVGSGVVEVIGVGIFLTLPKGILCVR